MPLFRRSLSVAALALAGALLAASCSSGGEESTSSNSGDGAFPVTLDHAYGTTEITAQPTKVVTLGLSDQDALLALGVAPIAVSEWYGSYPSAAWPWAQDELGDATPVVLNNGTRDESNPPIEEVASLEPDLIISLYNALTREQYEQLSQIAPTVVPTEEYANFGMTWQESTRVTGCALGREDDANALIDRLGARFADAAAAHPEFAGKEIVIGERFEPGQSIVRAGKDVRAQFFEQLGFAVPQTIAGQSPSEYGEMTVSDEFLSELSKDVLVWNIGFAPDERATIEGLPGYANLPVVQNGKVLWVDDDVISGAFTWGTVLSLDYALDNLVPPLTEVVDG